MTFEILAAAEDDPQRLAFLRSLALVALRLNGEPPNKITQTLRQDIRPGVSFLKGLGIPTAAYAALLQASGHGGDITEEARDFRTVFYSVYKDKFKTRVNIFNAAHQAFLDKVLAFFNRKSENAFNETRNTVSGLKDPELNRLFAFESTKTKGVDVDSLFNTMKSARKIGRKQLSLIEAPVAMAAFKAEHPEAYTEWYEAYKALRNVFRDRVKVFVRKNADDKGLVPIKKLRQFFSADESLFEWFFPIGLDDKFVDESNRLHLSDGTPIVTGVGTPVEPIPATQYTPNAGYKKSTKANPAYLHYPNAMGTGNTPLYLADNRKVSKAAADAAVTEIMEKWPTVSPKLLRDLGSRDYNKRVAATILEIIYQVAARIGGDGLTKVTDKTTGITKEQPTYGISSILKKHVKIKGSVVTIAYPGKKHVAQEHVLDAGANPAMARVVENIKEFVDGKKPLEPVFTLNDGKRISGTAVNAYLRSFGFKEPKVSAHKLRHVNGDSIVKPLFDAYEAPAKATAETLKKAFVQIMTKAGEKLGHKSGENVTWTTASKSYVSPGLQKAFFTDRGFLPIKQVAQLSSSDD